MATKKRNFPVPENTKRGESVVMIDPDEVFALYNQDFPEKPAQRITKKVKAHMDHLSQQNGWLGTAHVKNAKTGHAAGLLLMAPQQTVNVSVLVIPDNEKEPGKKIRNYESDDITDV